MLMDDYERLSNYFSMNKIIKDSIEYDCEILKQLLEAKKFDQVKYFLWKRLGAPFKIETSRD